MGKTALVILGVLVFSLVFGGCTVFTWGTGVYNDLTAMGQEVDSSWAQVENVYQRRFDLIPNLVETVKGYATHERETFTAVTEARAKVGQINLNAGQLTQVNLAQFQSAQGELSNALSRLMVVVEKYPELKANEGFLQLQSQLEGTENRITVERKRYNETALPYNTKRKQFPSNLVVGFFPDQFPEKAYFKAEKDAQKAPKVDFSSKEKG